MDRVERVERLNRLVKRCDNRADHHASVAVLLLLDDQPDLARSAAERSERARQRAQQINKAITKELTR